MVRIALLTTALLLAAEGARILQGNDDGWAEQYLRVFNDALNAAGHDVVLSSPAENKSGTGSLDVEPSPRKSACEYNSCLPNSGPVGSNTTSPRLNWVNSYPVTGVRYGIDTFGPQFWNGQKPDLVVTGPNVGSNLWLSVPFSGTVGGAVYAVYDAGVPAIAFSGASDGNMAWNAPTAQRSVVYAQLATNLTNALLASGAPYLPQGVWLNVNFPAVDGQCTQASNFRWVLSRINPGIVSQPDVQQCGSKRLPTETDVVKTAGCYIAVSPGDANDKTTVDAARQAVVLQKLAKMLTCLP